MQIFPGGLHGAYSRPQLEQILGRSALRAELRDGWLISFAKNVVVEQRRAAEFHTRAAAALLLAGGDAALTGPTAVRLYGYSVADQAPIHVLLPYERSSRSRPGVIIHRGRFTADDVHRLSGLQVVSLEYALAEMLCRQRPQAALACLDQVLRGAAANQRNDLRGRIAEQVLNRHDPRGQRQAAVLLDLATGQAESPAESWTLLILVQAGLPAPTLQFAMCDINGREQYRLDFAWPELKIAVEYDGYLAHQGRERYDEARSDDLRRRGWIVIRATADDLKSPDRFLRAVRNAFQARKLAA